MPGLGTQYIAPEGYEQLEKGRVYHLLRNDDRASLVSLAWFSLTKVATRTSRKKKSPRYEPIAHLLRMDRDSFEKAVLDGTICLASIQASLPFWLDGLVQSDLDFSDQGRRAFKTSHRDRIDTKIAHIQPMVARFQDVLADEHPERVLNEHARTCRPKVNETKFRLWFFVYLAFGKNRFALHYATQRLGRWSRAECKSEVKRGASNKEKGKGYGYNASPEMIEKILTSYDSLKKLAVKAKIYRRALVHHFGCRTRKVGPRRREFFHPEGKPYPSRRMYWYYVEKFKGKIGVRRDRIGDVRERSQYAPYRGSFTSGVCNLMQRVESDAYAMKERPRGLLEGSELRTLRVVRRRDLRSGIFTGIGFSLGSETAAAYRMARFCEAIGKKLYCSFFGKEIDDDRWPCVGCSLHDFQDRGPGATPGAFSQDPEFDVVISTIPPSYSGQSHAVIESSHPRSPTNDDAPSYIRSDKNVIQLVCQEIERLLIQNESMDISDRIPDELIEVVDPPTPNALWTELDRLGRNDALPISFDEAVRAFLTPVSAKLSRKGVRLLGRYFNSGAFDATGFRNSLSGRQSVDVSVYVLDACVRHIWIEIQGRIVQLDMQLPYWAANEELFIPLEDLRERERFMKEHRNSNEEHVAAVAAEGESDYKAQTGKSMDSGTRVAGRPKTTKLAQREEVEAKEVMKGRRRA